MDKTPWTNKKKKNIFFFDLKRFDQNLMKHKKFSIQASNPTKL